MIRNELEALDEGPVSPRWTSLTDVRQIDSVLIGMVAEYFDN